MRRIALAAVAALLFAPALSPADPNAAGAFNIKVLTNHQPDYSDAVSFARSASYGLETYEQKAISMWKWTSLSRVQTDVTVGEFCVLGKNPAYKGSDFYYQSEMDFVTYMNSAPTQFCGFICPSLGAAWGLYTGLPWATNNIALHTTVDLWYDGKFHMFDPSFNHYVRNDKGDVANSLEIQANYRNDKGSWYAGPQNPFRMSDNLEGELSYEPGRKMGEFPKKYDHVKRTHGGGEAINQVTLGMRPYTYYKRYKDPIAAKDENYFVPSRGDGVTPPIDGKGGGLFPNHYWKNNRAATNGEWVIAPDFNKPDWTESTLATDNISTVGGVVSPMAAGKDASVVLNINAYHSVAHMQIDANAVRGEGDTLDVLISYDAGRSWKTLESGITGEFSKLYRAEVLAKKAYLLKFNLKAASDPKSVGLKSLKVRVVTQVNRLNFLRLDRGTNQVYVNLGPQLERIEFRPDYKPETILSFMDSSSNIKAGHGPFRNNADLQDATKPGHAIYKIEAPGPVKRITMAGVFGVWDPTGPMSLHYSTDQGKTWTKFEKGDVPLSDGILGVKPSESDDNKGHAQYTQMFCTAALKNNTATTVLFKVQFDPKAKPKYYPNGIWKLWMAADYAPNGFRPVEVTLAWKEFRRDGSTPVRTYKKTISSPTEWTKFDVNVAGYRPPLMQYLTVNNVGFNPDQVPEGYGDGVDVGTGDTPEKFVYTKENNLSKGRPITAKPGPMGGQDINRLVDEFVSGNYFVTGARWRPGQNPEVIVTLDAEEEIQGITLHESVGVGDHVYPDSVEVSVSSDQTTWTRTGAISKYDVWNWPRDYLPFTFETIGDDKNFRGGIRNYNFHLLFDKPVKGKYVKLKVTSADYWTPTELRVWGKMSRKPYKGDNFEHDKINQAATSVAGKAAR